MDIQVGFVGKESFGVELGDLSRRLPFGDGCGDHLIFALLQNFLAHVADIGDVFYVLDFQTL